jgi:TPR repeat protein
LSGIPDKSLAQLVASRCRFKFVPKSFSPLEVAGEIACLKQPQTGRRTHEVFSAFRNAVGVFGAIVDFPVAAPAAAFSVSRRLSGNDVATWLCDRASDAGLPEAQVACATRAGVSREVAVPLLERAAYNGSAAAHLALYELTGDRSHFTVAFHKLYPPALVRKSEEEVATGDFDAAVLTLTSLDDDLLHIQLLNVLQTPLQTPSTQFYDAALSESRYWLPSSPSNSFRCYRVFARSGRNDFDLFRRIAFAHSCPPFESTFDVAKARAAFEAGSKPAGIRYVELALKNKSSDPNLLAILDSLLPLPGAYHLLGDCYDQSLLGLPQDCDLAYDAYRNELLGLASPTKQSDAVCATLANYIVNAAVMDLLGKGCELIELMAKYDVFQGNVQTLLVALGDAEPEVRLLLARRGVDSAATYEELIETCPALRTAAEYELALLPRSERKAKELLLSAAAGGNADAQKKLLSDHRDEVLEMAANWKSPLAVFHTVARFLRKGEKRKACRIARLIPPDVGVPHAGAPRELAHATLAIAWAKSLERGNEYEAALAKVTFARVMATTQMDEFVDWMMIVILIEQVFVDPATPFEPLLSPLLDDLIGALDRRPTSRHMPHHMSRLGYGRGWMDPMGDGFDGPVCPAAPPSFAEERRNLSARLTAKCGYRTIAPYGGHGFGYPDL